MPRGGRREGAGRPATLGPLTPVTVRLTEKDVKLLNRLTKRHKEDGPTGAIRAALRVAAKPVQPAPSGKVDSGAAVEALCRAIGAIGAGEEAEARSALGELGKAIGLSAADKRKVTGALTRAQKNLEPTGEVSEPRGSEPRAQVKPEAKRPPERTTPKSKPKAPPAAPSAPVEARGPSAPGKQRRSSCKAWFLVDGMKPQKKRIFVVVAPNKREALRLSHGRSMRSFDLTWKACTHDSAWFCATELGPGVWVIPASENFPKASKFKPVKLMPVF